MLTPRRYEDNMPTATVTFDATSIPTPSDLPPLATGSFGIPLNVNAAPYTCLTDTAQYKAWDCNIAFNQAVALQVQITRNAPQLGKDGTYDVLLVTDYSSVAREGDPEIPNLMYGASAPLIQPAMNLELVNDTFDLARGPAWYRMSPYNKTVVVPESGLHTSSSSKHRRGDPAFAPSPGSFQRKGMAEAGDRPWICVWPETYVEMFIYARQNSSYAEASTATITTRLPSTATATESGATATATGTGTEVISMNKLTAYPRAIKIKERRVVNSPRPYCYQVIVNDDNSTTPVTDTSGNVVAAVEIDENEEPDDIAKRHELSERSTGENGDMSECGCMWFSS